MCFNVSSKMLRNKLEGFTSFRATCVIRVQVNAQPFQAGRLILAAIPMPTLINPRDEYMMKHVTLLQGVNNVQLDISKQTEVSLRIPFISPFNAYDLINGQYPWARISLSVYSPLNEVEQTTLQVLVWAHFEDVELGAPTSALQQAVQQSGEVPLRQPDESVSSLRSLETGIGKILDTLKTGSSSIFDTVNSAYSAGRDTLGGLSSMLGFSKPQYQEPGCPVYIRPTTYFANVDGQDTSHILSLSKGNNVSSLTGLGGTNMDETSLEYVKRIPQYIASFGYTSETGYGSELWKCYVTPSFYIPQAVKVETGVSSSFPPNGTWQSNQPTVLNYISSAFMYWTGTIVYTFKFVKTDYHSGRVEISFHPFTNKADGTRTDYTYRMVVDLREKTEVSFSVPFISPQPWKVVQQVDPLTVPQDWSSVGPAVTGVVYVRALTPLVQASPIVAKCVECLVETRAGDDFRLQAPCRSWFAPVSIGKEDKAKVKQIQREVRDFHLRKFKNELKLDLSNAAIEQSGPFGIPGTQETRTSAIEGFTPISITQNEGDTHQVDTSMDCAGEVFGSFRALTRRFGFTGRWEMDKAAGLPILDIKPATYIRAPTLRYQTIQTPVPDENVWVKFRLDNSPSPLSYVSAMYAFYRGGLRFKVVTTGEPILYSGRIIYSMKGETQRTKQRYYPYMSPVGYEQFQSKRVAEYQVPFYSPTILSVHWDAENVSQFDQPSTVLQLSSTASKEDHTLYLAVAGADDFDLFGFLGVPFVVSEDVLSGTFETDGTYGTQDTFDLSLLDVDPAYPLDIVENPKGRIGNLVYLTIDQVKFTEATRTCPVPK